MWGVRVRRRARKVRGVQARLRTAEVRGIQVPGQAEVAVPDQTSRWTRAGMRASHPAEAGTRVGHPAGAATWRRASPVAGAVTQMRASPVAEAATWKRTNRAAARAQATHLAVRLRRAADHRAAAVGSGRVAQCRAMGSAHAMGARCGAGLRRAAGPCWTVGSRRARRQVWA
ncbi:hypothetical protein GCM10023170_009880 [Phytohabitans houttuyneae]|uniref:Uncharacterized protein n=1 Tax=Phytohabitans houttuyneae TaxID=1076126 RepID=A0A6V8KBM4_9ACTN|nr:hypothetical protein Phou_035560 [Phytohabitans houttuyneae]